MLSDRQVSGQGGHNNLKSTEQKVIQPILYDQTKFQTVVDPTIILVLPEELLL